MRTTGLRHWHLRKSPLALTILPALLAALSLTGLALAQSQSQPQTPPPAQPQPQSQQPAPSSSAVPPKAKASTASSTPAKVYRNRDLANLPPGGVSVVGPAAPSPSAAKVHAHSTASSAAARQAAEAAQAAYWKARFTEARNKLADDQNSLPFLQSQLEDERVQGDFVDEDTGQVYSDEFMSLLQQIGATKVAIQNDKQALSDLQDAFRRAGGLPGWIR